MLIIVMREFLAKYESIKMDYYQWDVRLHKQIYFDVLNAHASQVKIKSIYFYLFGYIILIFGQLRLMEKIKDHFQ